MFWIKGRFVKVWKIKEVKDKVVKIDLGTSDKQQDNTYKNSNWFNCSFIGKALDGAKRLKEGDKIEIVSAKIENVFVKEKNQSYINIAVFEFKLEEGQTTAPAPVEAVDHNQDEFPF
ncbi:MAG: hypothetical protein ACRCZ0_10025 [Cetobacterium sp.]